MKILILLLALTACSNENQASSKRIASEADSGEALKIYRHMQLMDEMAAEFKMIHPVDITKRGKK